MRALDKKKCKAKEYFNWQAAKPRKYYSSNKYYYDVLVSLLLCQGGVCAYSEIRLIDQEDLKSYNKKFDKNGKYTGNNPSVPAHIEHFNSQLKDVNGFKWDNLFAVFGPLNTTIKRVRENEFIEKNKIAISDIIKPDRKGYNHKSFLSYDLNDHCFYPSVLLSDKDFSLVEEMIYVLGLNWDYLRMNRKEYLFPILLKHNAGEKVKVNQFYSAFDLIIGI